MTRHRFDAFSFLTGAIAVAVGLLVLVDASALRLVDLRIIGPLLLLGLGLALLIGGGRDDGEASRATAGFDDPSGDDADTEASRGAADAEASRTAELEADPGPVGSTDDGDGGPDRRPPATR